MQVDRTTFAYDGNGGMGSIAYITVSLMSIGRAYTHFGKIGIERAGIGDDIGMKGGIMW